MPADFPSGSATAPVASSDRLESWKEIAAYLNRTVRTVQRWEREQGLPVHRLQHNRLASIYAHRQELDEWWEQRRTSLGVEGRESETALSTDAGSGGLHGGKSKVRTTATLMMTALFVGAVIGTAWIASGSRETTGGVRSIAVLPLTDTGSRVDQFIADGVADDLARLISRIRHVRVVARVPSSRATGANSDVRQLAARLDVDAVLRGTIVGQPSALRVDLELVHGDSGRILWTAHYQGNLHGFAARNASTALARNLFASVWPDEALPPSVSRPTDAYLAYLRGRYNLSKRLPDAVRAAEKLFAEAIRLDPTYPEAHAGLADAWLVMAIYGLTDRDGGLSRARATAEHALSLDASSAEAHTSFAFATELLDHQWSEAESHFRQAIALNPSYVPAHHWYALLLDCTLRGDEAIREIETALALDPFSTLLASDLGMILYHQKHYDRAIAQFAKVLAVDPGYADAHKELGQAYTHSGRFDLALESYDRARELGTNPGEIEAQKAIANALSGRKDEARKWVARMQGGGSNRGVAEVLLALGEHDRALEMMLEAKSSGEENLLVGRLFDPVRSHPRYLQLLRRSGLDRVVAH